MKTPSASSCARFRLACLLAVSLGLPDPLPAQESTTCCGAPYRFGFSREFIRSGTPGEGILDASPDCTASGASVEVHKAFPIFFNTISNAASEELAVQGFSASIEVSGLADITDAKLVGLANPSGNGGGGSASFFRLEIVDPSKNGGRRGVVAAVTFPEGPGPAGQLGPPHVGTESLIRLTVDRLPPADPHASGQVFPADGLRGGGQPVSNVVTAYGATQVLCNASTAGLAIQFTANARFRRGDPNQDGRFDISDAIFDFGYLFLGTAAPACFDSADANGDGRLDISDPSFILNFLFYGGVAPPDPGPPPGTCSADPGGNPLGCADYRPCT